MAIYKDLEKQVEIFEEELKRMQSGILRDLENYVNSTFKTKNGKYILDEGTDLTVDMTAKLQEVLAENGYYETVNEQLFDFNQEILANRLGEFPRIAPDFATEQLDALLRANFETLSGVSANTGNNLKRLLINSLVQNESVSQLAQKFSDELEKNLINHSATLMRTSRRMYYQEIENVIAESIDDEIIWVYAGAPLQGNSHQECIWALTAKPHTPYFTQAEKEEFEAGTLPAGLDRSAVRYNCQHYFQITSLTRKEYEKK